MCYEASKNVSISVLNPLTTLKSASRNLQSSSLHPAVIEEYLQNEVEMGQVAESISTPPMLNLHIINFGVIAKRNQAGQWQDNKISRLVQSYP